jgi:hypothetical protein
MNTYSGAAIPAFRRHVTVAYIDTPNDRLRAEKRGIFTKHKCDHYDWCTLSLTYGNTKYKTHRLRSDFASQKNCLFT